MKTYLFLARLHSGKLVMRVITGHKAVKAEMARVLNLRAFYKDFTVYSTL